MKYLLVGPLVPPVHGQSLAFTRFYESIAEKNKIIINTNLEDKSKIGKFAHTFRTLALIIYKTLFYQFDTVYFTCSRSFLGSIKDIFLINLANFRNKRIINHLHGSDFYDFIHNSPNWYQKILIHSYSKVHTSIVLLETMKEQFRDFPHMELHVVSNFYDNEFEKKLSTKTNSKISLLYLSNIMKSKGIFELIDAFEIISLKYSNVNLTIAGGFIADKFMNIEATKQLFYERIKDMRNIRYVGVLLGPNKVKLFQESDIFILPSYKEAIPISILEAMKSGNAIITTNYMYLPEIVKDLNGILIEPESVIDIVDAIEIFIKNEAMLRKIQTHNVLEATQKYSMQNYLDRLHHIVEEIV